MQSDCYCGKGFHVKKPKLLLIGSTQFCCLDCLHKFITDHTKEIPIRCKEQNVDFNPFEGRDVWDRVTRRFYRSRYEINFARYLHDSGHSYQYEPKFVQITKTKKYCPDFWLTHVHMFFEVKGLWGMGAKNKVRKAVDLGHPVVLVPDHLRAEFAEKYESKLDRVLR